MFTIVTQVKEIHLSCGITHFALNVRGWPWKGRRCTGRNEERGPSQLGGERAGSSWWTWRDANAPVVSWLEHVASWCRFSLVRCTGSTNWRSGCPSLILCRVAGRDPMQLGAAVLHADWLDGRTLGDWHLGQNCFVGGSHKVFLFPHLTYIPFMNTRFAKCYDEACSYVPSFHVLIFFSIMNS
jgi:hypothetical protein